MRLEIGNNFETASGPRRLYHIGSDYYFQKAQRRYLCRVIAIKEEAYHDGFGRRQQRQKLTVQIIND